MGPVPWIRTLVTCFSVFCACRPPPAPCPAHRPPLSACPSSPPSSFLPPIGGACLSHPRADGFLDRCQADPPTRRPRGSPLAVSP
eukprot:6956297-Pyramimonas_sp.AAC.1